LRLQTNLRLLGGRVAGLEFLPDLPELDAGGLEILDSKLARMAQTDPCRLLILDTLTALRKEQSGKNLVKADYEFMASIARLGRAWHCAILAISHTRKDAHNPDTVDAVDLHLGTTGITAAVDTLMVLTGAEDSKKVLRVKGRDISPFEVHLELQVDDRSGWVVVDAPAEPEKKISALRRRILDAVLALGPVGPDAVSNFTGDKPSTIRVYLPRMVKDGQLVKDSSGCYGLEVHTPSVTGVAPVTPVAEDPATVTPATPATPVSAPPTPVAPTQPAVIATPAPAAPTEPAAQNDVMPDGLTLDEKVRWCLASGIKRPFEMAKKMGEHMGVVIGSLNRQTTLHVLEEYEDNFCTGWRIIKRAAASKSSNEAYLM
jgi:hypothetical protein